MRCSLLAFRTQVECPRLRVARLSDRRSSAALLLPCAMHKFFGAVFATRVSQLFASCPDRHRDNKPRYCCTAQLGWLGSSFHTSSANTRRPPVPIASDQRPQKISFTTQLRAKTFAVHGIAVRSTRLRHYSSLGQSIQYSWEKKPRE